MNISFVAKTEDKSVNIGISDIYYIATGVVMLFGFIVGWFYKSNFWMAFIYVGIVLVAAFLIDEIKTKKDIDYINSRIKKKESGAK